MTVGHSDKEKLVVDTDLVPWMVDTVLEHTNWIEVETDLVVVVDIGVDTNLFGVDMD